jgi:hypothetical protein
MRGDVSPVRSLKTVPPCLREAHGSKLHHSAPAPYPEILFMIWIKPRPAALGNGWY